ncbi:uncharacterized protein Pyn_16008 [Prunus yedoensis var. nudiflora]|uniref:FYVE-type domain-containing protein n=1 Tax=Prunus yedoensis var. nudiflora TaxID=2094558 RepID=A0A314YQ78_PRUYE|nr:uncharacterized protein Pyn_16008 [Prunus yedoensis var. nudiflora]
MTSSKKHHKEKVIRRKEEKAEQPELPKYRDRAKERREDQNPDYEQTELGSFHAVAPPGNVDLRAAEAQKLSIEKSKYLGGDVEHTHLVKGLDYALLNKIRSEIDKKPDAEDEADAKSRASKEDQKLSFRTATAKSVYQCIVKPQAVIKTNEMFLPGRMSFIFNMEGGYTHDIPTTLHRSKADCPQPEEMVTVSVDGSVLDRIAKIMSYLRLGSSGKVLKKKKKEKDAKVIGKISIIGNEYVEEDKPSKPDAGTSKNETKREILPPPPPPPPGPPPRKNHIDSKAQQVPTMARADEDDIFVGDGVDYAIPGKDLSQSPLSEDMEESPRNKEKVSYFDEPVYGPVQPYGAPQEWQETNGYDATQTQMAGASRYLQPNMEGYDVEAGLNIQDPRFMTQEEKDRGLGSVFKRDDQRLQQLREKDAREKDPNFISESYSECYPGYQEYNREIVDSDDEDDLSKMDMGGRLDLINSAWKNRMASFEGRVSYSSLPKTDKRQTQFHYDDEFIGSEWTEPEDGAKVSYPPVASKPLKQDYAFQFPLESEDYIDGSGYDSSEEPCDSAQTNMHPEVNLKNVLSGMVAILTGRNKAPGPPSDKQLPNSNVSFLGSEKNGETYLHSSVYTPSAPPLLEPTAFDYNAYKDVLEAEPPEWLPDSSTTVCMQCTFPFTALTRGRHHCRFCGGVFCRTCSKGRCLLPVKFRERNPQRVCDACYDRLDPLQGILINNICNASQAAKHDVMDWTCTRGWLNLPVGFSMEHEIYKASNTLRSYSQVARLNPERSIPLAVLRGAKGLAILTVAKAGVLLSYKLGTGLVIARRSDGSWSAPSSIFSVGLGWGAQIGGELMDFIIVLHDLKAVKTFCSRMHFSLGAGCSVAAGPIGRVLEADMRAGDRGSGMCYTYSCSKGAFVGVSLEGNIVATRMDTNLQFYGDPYLTTSDILLGTVDRPKAAEPLYTALENLYSSLEW